MKHYHQNRSKRVGHDIKNQHGFTLIELMIVIAVVAILMATAGPAFETLVQGPAGNRAMLLLASDLKLTRMKAIRSNKAMVVSFNDPEQGQYTVKWEDEDFSDFEKVVELDQGNGWIGFDADPPGGAGEPDPDASLKFTNLGFIEPSSGGNTGNIYLVNNYNGQRYCITTTNIGDIDERRWNGSEWSGQIYEHFE